MPRINSPFLQEEHSNGPLGNHCPWLNPWSSTLSPQKWIDAEEVGSQSHSGPFSDGHRAGSGHSDPALGYLLEPQGKKQSGCVAQPGKPYMGKPSLNLMLMQRKATQRQSERGGQGFLTLFETGSNQTWNNTYPCIFSITWTKKYFFLPSFCLSQFEYCFLFKP